MRVLVTTDTVGGVWTYVATLARGLVARGDACLVAAIGEPSEAQRALLPAEVEVEWAPHTLEWLPGASEADLRAAAGWIRALGGRWGAEILHLNQFAYAAERFDAPTLVVAHSDVFSWFREVRDSEPGPEWAAYRQWVRAGLAGADAIVAPTAYQSGMLARHYGRAADRVIHNGSAPPGTTVRPASERPFVLTAGRAWDEAKGIDTLERALALLGDAAPPAVLAGPLEGPAGERWTPSRLSAVGSLSREEVNRLYEEAAIYVATSLYEPFGLSPLEAAGHGCALVLSDIGSFRELWQDAAVFVAPGAAEPLAAVLGDLGAEPQRTDMLAAAAAARARDYTEDRMVERYRTMYGLLADGGWRPRAPVRGTGVLTGTARGVG